MGSGTGPVAGGEGEAADGGERDGAGERQRTGAGAAELSRMSLGLEAEERENGWKVEPCKTDLYRRGGEKG